MRAIGGCVLSLARDRADKSDARACFPLGKAQRIEELTMKAPLGPPTPPSSLAPLRQGASAFPRRPAIERAVERETGLEPATSTLGRWHSAN